MATEGLPDPLKWLDEAATHRAAADLTRHLPTRTAVDAEALDLASNDYLGLARTHAVTSAAVVAAREWGVGATGSRLVTGSTALHAELETELAELYGTESALVFSSGYAANLGMVTALCPRTGHLVCDRNNHASLIDATRLARAAGAGLSLYAHASPGDAGAQLGRAAGAPARLVVSDTVFSVDGDLTDIPGLLAACRAHDAALLLDDAHGLGVLGTHGTGALAAAGLAGPRGAPRAELGDVVVSVTLSKALGAQGGAVLGPRRVTEHLVSTARTFIFDTGLAPPAAAGALAALRQLRAQPELAGRVRTVARRFATELRRAGLTVREPDAAVTSVRAPSPEAAVAWQQRCRTAGLRVGCFRPPSVPDGVSRLRVTARADLSDVEVERAIDILVSTAPREAHRIQSDGTAGPTAS